jgi:hypothetical protein
MFWHLVSTCYGELTLYRNVICLEKYEKHTTKPHKVLVYELYKMKLIQIYIICLIGRKTHIVLRMR